MSIYTLNKTYVKSNFQWEEKDISGVTLAAALKYQDVRFNVTVMATGQPRDAILSRNRTMVAGTNSTITVADWVNGLTTELTTIAAARGLVDTNVATFEHLEDVAVKLVKGSIKYPNASVIPYGMDTDVVFSTGRDSTDVFYEHNICKYIMPVVNGSFHPIQFIDKNVYILNGMDSVRTEKKNIRTDFLNFSEIGTLEQYLLGTETTMALVPRTAQDIAEGVQRVSIKLNGASQSNSLGSKLPILIINGNMRIFTKDLFIASDDTLVYKLHLNTEIYLASKNLPNTKRYLDPANITSDAVSVPSFNVLAYLQTELCFLTVLDAADISFFTDRLQPSDGPMQYVHSRAPKGLIFFDDGRVTHWNIQGYNDNTVSIVTDDNYQGDQLYDRTLLRNINAYSNNRFAQKTPTYFGAYTLELYAFK